MASVAVIEHQLVATFNRLIPEDLRIDSGDACLLFPGATEQPEDPALSHRITADDLGDDQREVGLRLAKRIAMTSQWPAVPEDWAHFKPSIKPLLSDATLNPRSSFSDLDDELARLKRENDETIQAWLSTDEMLRESREEIKRLEEMMLKLAMADPPQELRTRSIRNTVSSAREKLNYVVIPESAEQRLDLLDQHYCAASWADELARALVALEAFAIDAHKLRTNLDFKAWCTKTGKFADSKVAMHEAETTEHSESLMADRVFPVMEGLNSSGKMMMRTHIKIQARGKGIIPRLYFHDDTRGRTGKIHVGFIGPHDLVRHGNWK